MKEEEGATVPPKADSQKKSSVASNRASSGATTVKGSATKPPRARGNARSKCSGGNSIIYLDFDWGIDNIDLFMLAYIAAVEKVGDDGHCGYRSLARLLGKPEQQYVEIRLDLSKHLQ